MTDRQTLVVEGWRFLPHSYAIVNQWQLLALARRNDIALTIRDAPLPYRKWSTMRGVLPAAAEAEIEKLPLAVPGEEFDFTYRMGFPYDFRIATGKRTSVFVTSEYQSLAAPNFLGRPDYSALIGDERFIVVTPSRWSSVAVEKLGFGADQIAIIPHGVEPGIFRPDPEQRTIVRARMKFEGFVFFHNGAMTPNKGIDLLLKAFAIVAEKRPEARLLLKGLDSLHDSSDRVRALLGAMSAAERDLVLARTGFIGSALKMDEVAALYQASDAYVSPYRAEGFNIPVLEAAACGLPVICSEGGATDDFVASPFARKIDSTIEDVAYDGLPSRHLIPDFDNLVELMFEAMDDASWRRDAFEHGPRHAHVHYNWDAIAGRILHALTGDA